MYVIDADGRIAMREAWNHPADVAAALRALQLGIEPSIPESTDMLRQPGGRPLGQRILDRGGMKALRDFYMIAPAALQDALRNSPSAEVRAASAGFFAGVAERVTVTSKDGTPIALWKSGSGPSLLVVHGTGADHSAWDSVVPLLADTFTIYAMDRRGRGASGDAPEYALEREVEDVVAAVEALPGPVYLYGHSSGGMFSLDAASRTRNLKKVVSALKEVRVRALPGQPRAAHQTAPGLLANAIRDFFLGDYKRLPFLNREENTRCPLQRSTLPTCITRSPAVVNRWSWSMARGAITTTGIRWCHCSANPFRWSRSTAADTARARLAQARAASPRTRTIWPP